MPNFIYVNDVVTSLAGNVASSATSLTLASSAGLPSSIPTGYVLALTLRDQTTRLNTEIVYATNISGATLSGLQRGQEGTTAQNWLVGDYAYSGPTAGQMGNFLQAPLTHGLLLNVQVLTASGTYNPTTGATYGVVDVVAAGGGGGYASANNIGSGGGGGGFARAFLNALTSQAVVIGAGGIGGTSTVAATNGGNSSFGSVSASGGKAGAFNSNAGGNPGIGSGGNINLSGSSGAGGILLAGSVGLFLGGFGGTTPGYSTTSGYVQGGPGIPATGPGGGGGGGANGNNGGNGAAGLVVVWEYS